MRDADPVIAAHIRRFEAVAAIRVGLDEFAIFRTISEVTPFDHRAGQWISIGIRHLAAEHTRELRGSVGIIGNAGDEWGQNEQNGGERAACGQHRVPFGLMSA